jgi:4-amino-4-deoxy-L-arabinose transferase-like glycosyltransferase
MTLITGEMQSAATRPAVRSAARSRLRAALLLALTLCAAALRLWKADWALPYVPHPDEPAIMNVVLRMLRNGDFNPHFFYYPSVWIYVQAAVSWLHLQWGTASGLYAGAAQLPETTDIATSVPGFFVWGRVATALAGAATVPLVFRLAQRLAGSLAGFAAALLLCVNTFNVINSHYITTDVPATFWTALALVATLRVLDHGTWRAYLLAGALAGLAAGTKHNAALTAAAIAAAHALRWRGRMVWTAPRLLGAAAAMIGAFLLTSPYIVLAWGEFRVELG